MSGRERQLQSVEGANNLVDELGRIFPERVYPTVSVNHASNFDAAAMLTLPGNQVTIEDAEGRVASSNAVATKIVRKRYGHIIGLFAREHGVHELYAVHILLWAPRIPGVLAKVQIREDGDLERAVLCEGQPWLVRIRVQVEVVGLRSCSGEADMVCRSRGPNLVCQPPNNGDESLYLVRQGVPNKVEGSLRLPQGCPAGVAKQAASSW